MNLTHLSEPWIGRRIGDGQRYRLDKRLGTGGMADVFLATDTLIGKQVALKLLKDTFVGSADLRKRFEREVTVSAALKSEHIVEVSDYGVTDEVQPFYVMEYLRGQTLRQLLQQQQRLTVERTVTIISQVCDGLKLAHEGVILWQDQGRWSEHVQVIHRDLKPDNIFLMPTSLGELVKILDFGIAKIRNNYFEHTKLTSMFIGTIHYAAPEQFATKTTGVDRRTDIYSLGMLLYQMLSGTDPFGLGRNPQEISPMSWFVAHTSEQPIPLRSQIDCEYIQPEIEAAVMQCLQKDPDDRFATVDELKRVLQLAFANESEFSKSTMHFGKEIPVDTDEPDPQNKSIFYLNQTVAESIEKVRTYDLLPNTLIEEAKEEGEEKGQDQKKLQPLLRKATLVAAALAASVSLAIYTFTQLQANLHQAVLESAKQLKAEKKFDECVKKAQAVPQKSSIYVAAQNIINECQLAQAKDLAQNNNIKDAIAKLTIIASNSSFYQEAQHLISQWSEKLFTQAQELYLKSYNSQGFENAINMIKAIPKTSSVAKNAHETIQKWQTEWKNNENYLLLAQNALNESKWAEAINQANHVRLLRQPVKQDTHYWQTKMKPIIEKAEEQITASKNTPKPTILPQADRSDSTPRPVKSKSLPRVVRYKSLSKPVRTKSLPRVVRSKSTPKSVWIKSRQKTQPQSPPRLVQSKPPRKTQSEPAPNTGWSKKRL